MQQSPSLPERRRMAARRFGTLAGLCALGLLWASGPAAAGGVGAIWTTAFEHGDGLKITLASSTPVGAGPDAIRACFVLSNTNAAPAPPLGAGTFAAAAKISATDTVGSGLAFELVSPVAEDTGGIDVACSLVSPTEAKIEPIASGPLPGQIPPATVTDKCCFGIKAPAAPGGGAGGGLFSSSGSCDPAYPECVPGTGDELLYVLQSDSGPEQSSETIYIWSLGAPGCGLVGLEALLAWIAARGLRRRRSDGARRGDER